MVETKPVSQWVSKWKTNAGGAATYYQTGAIAAAGKYATNAGASGPTYAAGVQEAIGRGAYQAGVQRAGSQGYSNGVQMKGAARYPGGIAAGEQAYNAGAQRVASVIQGVTLSARQPRGSPANLQRVAEIANALHQARISGGA